MPETPWAQPYGMGGPTDVTLGEVSRSLHEFRTQYVRDQKEAAEARTELRRAIESLQFVTPAVYAAHRESDLRRIKALEMEAMKGIEDRKRSELDRRNNNRLWVVSGIGWLIAVGTFLASYPGLPL